MRHVFFIYDYVLDFLMLAIFKIIFVFDFNHYWINEKKTTTSGSFFGYEGHYLKLNSI